MDGGAREEQHARDIGVDADAGGISGVRFGRAGIGWE
jgi:hypothetical protein